MNALLRDWDLWGPLVFSLILALEVSIGTCQAVQILPPHLALGFVFHRNCSTQIPLFKQILSKITL